MLELDVSDETIQIHIQIQLALGTNLDSDLIWHKLVLVFVT